MRGVLYQSTLAIECDMFGYIEEMVWTGAESWTLCTGITYHLTGTATLNLSSRNYLCGMLDGI